MTHDDGGPAFPYKPDEERDLGGGITAHKDGDVPGMTIHDYFMAKVAQGLSANPNYVVGTVDEIVAAASKYATAMIAENRAEYARLANRDKELKAALRPISFR